MSLLQTLMSADSEEPAVMVAASTLRAASGVNVMRVLFSQRMEATAQVCLRQCCLLLV